MNSATAQQPTDPGLDASVHASAGTGKTWLLVTRVLRLLLAGVPVDSLLAVTFTRKAAAEMEQRIMERLRELAEADAIRCGALLREAGVAEHADIQQRAAQLYEQVLVNPRRLRCTTFHAFCQDLLARFPLEAGIEPGMEVRETTGQLEQAAYDALLVQSTRAAQDPLTQALDALAVGCDSLDNARRALFSFLAQRSDWWAWTDGEQQPVEFAVRSLTRFLAIDPLGDPLAGYPDAIQRARHRAFAELLRDNQTSNDQTAAGHLEHALQQRLQGAAFLAAITPAYLTQAGEPRKRASSQAQQKRLGVERAAHYLELHEQGCAELQQQSDLLARRRSLELNTAWYRAGYELLRHYQRIKREQRVLDFADLEWQACRLLNRSEHASWVQYKLDARVSHLLVDEFQDTNPTQWQLLLPLLEELAAGDSDRARSVFLVGDRKQSIYGFRRANPALLETASAWLEQHRGALRFPLNESRRSALAIMECVNRVFTQTAAAGRLAGFEAHGTHLEDMYGHVELLPLCTGTDAAGPAAVTAASELRNPLHEPRAMAGDSAFHEEGRLIAQTIRALVEAGASGEKDGRVQPLDYGDILILLRQRTHATYYEQELRAAGIPCLAASRGLLLENLEVRDLLALLNCLVSPYDNLALAQALRSPLFGLDSEALLQLADADGSHWYARLAHLAGAGTEPWHAIHTLLEGWRTLAGQLPVHDLLDRLFHEGDILQRYRHAFPATLHPRLQSSFTRFIELALELDNGRYPSLPRFLDLLQRLRASDQDQPDEGAPDDSHGRRVRLLTIHAAKGLEAPVVFLADAATTPKDRTAWSACVDWPDGAARPQLVLLATRRDLRDSRTRRLLEHQAVATSQEEANLLYVALTRARQYLFVSGSARPNAADTGWYGILASALQSCARNADNHPCITSGNRKAPQAAAAGTDSPVAIDPALSGPIKLEPRDKQIAPSRLAPNNEHAPGDPDGRERGIAIHLMLDCITRNPDPAAGVMRVDIANRLQRATHDAELRDWWSEAHSIVSSPAFAALFEPAQYQQAYNEVPVQYLANGCMVYGVIDRLVLTADQALVIDYKTHASATAGRLAQLVAEYRAQLDCYAQAASLLWPQRTVRAGLLFTACRELVWLDAVQSNGPVNPDSLSPK